MSAAAAKKRPPAFMTQVSVDYVDVDIWVYVGKEGGPTISTDHLEALIRANHDAEHDGPMRWCRHPLCEEVER